MVMRIHRFPVTGPILGDLFNFEQEIGSLFDHFLGVPGPARMGGYPAVDLAEYEDEVVLAAELPGVAKEDVKVSVENGLLTIRGERKGRGVPESSRWIRNEVATGEFARVIELPRSVDASKVSAELSNGILRISLPKSEAVRPREIRIS